MDDSRDLQTDDASHRQPLISATSPTDDGVREPTKPSSPRNDHQLDSSTSAASPRLSAAAAADDDDLDDDDVQTSDLTSSLIGKASSHASLDSYDRTLNPFFVD